MSDFLDNIWADTLYQIVQLEEGSIKPLTLDQRVAAARKYLTEEYGITEGDIFDNLEFMDYDDGVFFKDMDFVHNTI